MSEKNGTGGAWDRSWSHSGNVPPGREVKNEKDGYAMTDKERIDLITSIAEDIAEINGKEDKPCHTTGQR